MEPIHWTSYATAIGAIFAAIATGAAAFANWRASVAAKNAAIAAEESIQLERNVLIEVLIQRIYIDRSNNSARSSFSIVIINLSRFPVIIESISVFGEMDGRTLSKRDYNAIIPALSYNLDEFWCIIELKEDYDFSHLRVVVKTRPGYVFEFLYSHTGEGNSTELIKRYPSTPVTRIAPVMFASSSNETLAPDAGNGRREV